MPWGAFFYGSSYGLLHVVVGLSLIVSTALAGGPVKCSGSLSCWNVLLADIICMLKMKNNTFKLHTPQASDFVLQ
jgi:hypothetical protein